MKVFWFNVFEAEQNLISELTVPSPPVYDTVHYEKEMAASFLFASSAGQDT